MSLIEKVLFGVLSFQAIALTMWLFLLRSEMKEDSKKTKDENRQLTKALVSCQEELAHMNEKLLMQESTNETLKTKLKEPYSKQ